MSANLITLVKKHGGYTWQDEDGFRINIPPKHVAAFAAALSSKEAEPSEEPGWQLVPVKPTYAMLRAYATCWKGFEIRGTELGTRACHEWKAMLAAAPKLAATQAPQEEKP